uniref:Small ribosomal subunit protein mS39 n=1 Tax=Myripristis murdjan TaxID=586833 RepID=A0A667XW16_9TELE
MMFLSNRSKEAVLEALASTVNRVRAPSRLSHLTVSVCALVGLFNLPVCDPTAYKYQFQDDPYLAPRTSAEFKLFSLSQESGRSAAKYFINSNPKFFTKDFAEPHIPCLMPEKVSLLLEEVSEEALKERISLRKVKAAVDMYDQLLQAGTGVSMETTHDLLDLICLYSDREPVQEGGPETEDSMSKISAVSSAADVRIFNALISGAPEVREKYNERWDLIAELLNQMNQQKVQPNLLTFNSVLKALRRCGSLARTQALHTLSEMKALGIGQCAPAGCDVCIKLLFLSKASPTQGQTDLLQEVMSELAGSSFTCQDPDDGKLWSVCLDNKDIELAYRVQSLVEAGENWRLLGDSHQQTIYYGRFFSLLCMMEHIDVVLKWYRKLIPSLYYPNVQGMRDLLQALDTDSRLDLLPTIWKDIQLLGHANKSELIEELLALMARETHSPEVQESFAVCALDVKSVFNGDRGTLSLEWSTSALCHITSLLLRAKRTQEAWEMLQLFKAKNRVPSEELMNEFLLECHAAGAPDRAVELVQLSAAFCLPATPRLAQQTLKDFDLTDEQR